MVINVSFFIMVRVDSSYKFTIIFKILTYSLQQFDLPGNMLFGYRV